MEMKTCPHCGARMPEEAAFCPHCARSVNSRKEVTRPDGCPGGWCVFLWFFWS